MRRSYHMGTELRDTEIDRRLRGRSEIEAELAVVEADLAKRLEGAGPDRHRDGRGPAHARGGARRPDRRPRRAARGARRQATARITRPDPGRRGPGDSERNSALEALGPIAKEPRARERLEVEVRDQETALEGARDDEANARARVEANAVDAEEVAGHAESLARWNEELAALQRRQRVYTTALDMIVKAEQATMKSATRFLEKRMVRDLDGATAGRYRHVRVDDKTLDIEVRAPEKRDWVKVTALSQGTMDLVYLTARLGLVRLVTGDRRPPLIFDDPFVTLDDARAARALTLLKGITTDFQVIYLTCSERYDAVADAVVELPGPTAVDDDAPPEDPAPDRTRPGDRDRPVRAGVRRRVGRR